MPTNLLTAMSGQQSASDTATGPQSYDTGGFSVRTSLGRVDRATASVDNGDREARVTDTGSQDTANYVNIQVYQQGGAGEVSQDTDLSGDEFLIDAKRL